MNTLRQRKIMDILTTSARPMDPRDLADALTAVGLPSHPSAAARAVRKLCSRGAVKALHEREPASFGQSGDQRALKRVPLNKEKRKLTMGASEDAIETTACFLYELQRRL